MSSIRIVLIEDEPPIRQMYEMKLVSAGFAVKSAPDGSEGLKIIEEFRPDIVLLDLRMPVMDGQEMLFRLREHDWGNNIPVIVLTNVSQSEASLDMRFLKVDKYIVKAHYTPSQIVEEVNAVLKRYGKIDKT